MNEEVNPRIHKLSISPVKGERKKNVKTVRVLDSGGFEGDAHSGSYRAISLLPYESFSKVRDAGLDVNPGDFAENITTVGLDFRRLSIGARIAMGASVIIDIVQIGKECHGGCEIKQITGDCIMPREGVFARAVSGGILREGDPIRFLS